MGSGSHPLSAAATERNSIRLKIRALVKNLICFCLVNGMQIFNINSPYAE